MLASEITIPNEEPVIIITRLFDASQKLVYKLFTDPYHLAQFWGPEGATIHISRMDVRPGGMWNLVMRFANGMEMPVSSMFVEVWEPYLLVYRDVATITFENVGGKTRLTAHVRLNSIAARDMTVQGGFADTVARSHERLDAYLRTL